MKFSTSKCKVMRIGNGVKRPDCNCILGEAVYKNQSMKGNLKLTSLRIHHRKKVMKRDVKKVNCILVNVKIIVPSMLVL